MRISILLTFLCLSAFFSASGQPDSSGTVFSSKEFKWKMVIPAGYKPMGEEEWGKMQKRGEAVLEKANGIEVENHAVTLFVYRLDAMHSIDANWQTLSKEDVKDIEGINRLVGDAVYNAIKSQVGNATIDTAYNKEPIDGLTFNVFTLKVEMKPGKYLYMVMFSRLFGQKEFSFNCVAVENEKLDAAIAAFRRSTFH